MTTTSTMSRSFPTFRSAAAPLRWGFRTRRRRRIIASALLAIAAAPVLWWSLQLAALPDIGEPFDLEAFRAFKVPDDRNAFALYARAAAMLEDTGHRGGYDPRFWEKWLNPWSKTDPAIRRLVETNREAMALYREAADRPDSQPLPPLDAWKTLPALPQFHMMAMLEASRLEERGEMAAAWAWYRAVLRSLRHEARCGGFHQRHITPLWNDELRRRLATWARSPRTTRADLRRAFDDAIACDAIAVSDSDDLKRAYLHLLPKLEDGPGDFAAQINIRKWQALFGATDQYLLLDQMQRLYDWWRRWHRESVRRRRIVRLAVANWLAYLDAPPDRRPFPDLKVTGPYDFFILGPEAPATSRALPALELDRWLDSSPEAREKLDDLIGLGGFRPSVGWIDRMHVDESARRNALLVLLTSEIYRRDHGFTWPIGFVAPDFETLPEVGPGKGDDPAQFR